MVWTTYKEKIHRYSERIVQAQRPIRILDAIKWPASVEEDLIKSKYQEIPDIGPDYYSTLELGFEPIKKRDELADIIVEIRRDLGSDDPLARLLSEIAEEYILVVEMLEARGTREFWEHSRRLYGSPQDKFFDDRNTISDLGQLLYTILSGIDEKEIGSDYPEVIPADEVVKTLNQRFRKYFPEDTVQAKVSDGILADAAAGGDTVKIKEGSLFSSRDIDILEVHEGWVHVGTTQNGNSQHVAKFLSKGSPRVSSTQEGLAVIMEIFTFRTYPKRARQINDRILAIHKAEQGANLLEIIEFYRTEGYSEADCVANAKRVCRGGLATGGAPFTKDISYCKGFIENYNFMRAAVRAGKAHLIPFLFVGKLRVDDVPLLYQKYEEGIVDPPKYLPPQFRDMGGVAVWMGFSSFLNQVDLKKIQEYYNRLFKEFS